MMPEIGDQVTIRVTRYKRRKNGRRIWGGHGVVGDMDQSIEYDPDQVLGFREVAICAFKGIRVGTLITGTLAEGDRFDPTKKQHTRVLKLRDISLIVRSDGKRLFPADGY